MVNWLILSGMSSFSCKMCGNCCSNGWNIYLKEEEYKKLVRIVDKDKINQSIELLPEEMKDIGFAKFNHGHKRCSFMEKNKLCYIHKEHGFDYLPHICTVFPRKIVITPRGIEVSIEFSCPETMKLLLSKEIMDVKINPPGFSFDISHLSLPTITDEFMNSNDETRWYFSVEEAILNVLQDRLFTVEMRLAIVGLLIFIFQKYANDEDRMQYYPEILNNYRNLAKQVHQIQPKVEHQLSILIGFINYRMKSQVSEEFIHYGKLINKMFNSIGNNFNVKYFIEKLDDTYFEREYGYIVANYLTANVFSKNLYINGFEGGFHALSYLYALIRLFALAIAYENCKPINEEVLLKAVSIVDYNVTHSSGFMDHILLAQGINKHQPEHFSVARSLALLLTRNT